MNTDKPGAAIGGSQTILQKRKTKRRGAKAAEARRGKWMNCNFIYLGQQQGIEKMKSFLCDPLRPPRLCVEKDISIRQ